MSEGNAKLYGTHIVITSSDETPNVIIGKNFKIHFIRQENYKGIIEHYVEHEVIIEAKSISRAQFACDLILCSMCLKDSMLIGLRDIAVYPIDSDNNEKPLYYNTINKFDTPNIPLYCTIASKISFRRSYINAINKYLLSCEIHSTHWVDLDPSNGPIIPLSPFPYDHLRYGYAIVIAYSVVEELNLGVHASSNKPSLIKGKWNQVVKDDLENRLLKANIDIKDPIVWERRGSKKNLEKRRAPELVKKASWAYGNIRDCEVLIIDAINSISWLRSRIAAHKVDTDIKSLSVYDVSNAQCLARRLILESLGFWKINE